MTTPVLVCESHDLSLRVVVVASRGAVFCSGHDLGEMVGRAVGDYGSLFGVCSEVMLSLRSPTP